ncbi:family 16 glycoside hydrolase [Persicobacter sp. CCB-QB2]|uniref:family 16 glycoside hydrolase n=1 Tax=Persicobacter sp. CCB-QB2 TaxID=1561025 RepID=UPI0020A0F8DD|nr:family 16 glycoside hydrolase [Persicobacter sp. CCB-QB2]
MVGGVQPVDVFDPEKQQWETKCKAPMEIHHFQAVSYGDAIYLVGAMTGKYPKEEPLSHVWKYYPATDVWEKGHAIPEDRRRGGAGAVLYQDKIYLVCGIELGHTSGTNNYFDVYDPKTGSWEVLTKAPHIRDHFSVVIATDKLYCIGGRNTSHHLPDQFGAFFDATEATVDVYDFKQQRWYSLAEKLPYPTAAAGVVVFEDQIIYMGGESAAPIATQKTQALNLTTGEWTEYAPMLTGRHGSSAILHQGDIYFAAGSPNKGGGNLATIERFSIQHDWQALFNGSDLEGWEIKGDQGEKQYWSVEQGAIVGHTFEAHAPICLQTTKSYSHFELRLQFQSRRGNNSGVYIRSRWDENAKGKANSTPQMKGPRIDIAATSSWKNGLICDEADEHRRWLYPELADHHITKEDCKATNAVYFEPEGVLSWNDLRIVCTGNRIRTYLNNHLIANYDGTDVLDSKIYKKLKIYQQGHIALQLPQNPSGTIRFKQIEIRELNQATSRPNSSF